MDVADSFQVRSGTEILHVGAADLGGNSVPPFDDFVAIVRGEFAGLETDFHLLGIGRRDESAGFELLRSGVHDLGPDRENGVGAEGVRIDRFALVEARPDHAGDFGGVADEPVVGGVVFGSGLAGDRVVAQVEFLAGVFCRSELERVFEDAADLESGVAVDRLALGHRDMRGVDHVAQRVLDVVNDVGLVGVTAAVREDGVGERKFLRRGGISAEEGGVEILEIAFERHARVFGECHDRFGSHFLSHPYGGCVLRLGQCTASGDDIFVDVFDVFRSPFTQDTGGATDHDLAGIHGRVVDKRPRKESGFESGGVDERLECGSGGASALGNAVEHAVAEIASTHPGDDGTGAIVDHQERALEIFRRGKLLVGMGRLFEGGLLGLVLFKSRVIEIRMLLDHRELLVQRILGDLLDVTIDGGMDFEAPLRYCLVAEQFDHGLTHLLVDESRFAGDVRLGDGANRHLGETAQGVAVDVSLRLHSVENVISPAK